MHPDDDAAAVLTRVLYESPMRVSEFRDVSEAVDAVVAKALAKEPEARLPNGRRDERGLRSGAWDCGARRCRGVPARARRR